MCRAERPPKLLAEIVGHQGSLKAVKTIGDAVPQNKLFDSQLEQRFIEALRRKAADGSARIEVTGEIVRGKAGYFLTAGEHHWRVEPQVNLGPDQGVVIPSKPDFVLWPETDSGCLPIAVFLDGWKYHKDKVGDDIAKRMAMARSGRFSVWSLTYDDIARFLEPATAAPESRVVVGACGRNGCGHSDVRALRRSRAHQLPYADGV